MAKQGILYGSGTYTEAGGDRGSTFRVGLADGSASYSVSRAKEMGIQFDPTPITSQQLQQIQSGKSQLADFYSKAPTPVIDANSRGVVTSNVNPQVQPTIPSFALTGGSNLRVGSSGTDVSNLQTLLGGLAVDGKYGPLTQAAVIAFQKANGLTPDGIVGPNTTAMLNAKYGTGSSSNLTSPTTGGVSNGVPGVSGTYTPPGTTAGAANNVYYQSLNQQVTTLQQTLDKEYQRQLDTIQKDKERAADELSDIRDSQKDAIDETGELAAKEKKLKLDQLEIEQKRFDENYNIVQGLGAQLMDLMTKGNALIMEQKGVTGLGLIRNPRVTETINNITAAAGVIQAGIAVYTGQMGQAQNQLQIATSTITSAFGDQIDYYKSLANFYESMASDESQKLSVLTSTEQDFLQSKIASLEADVKRVKDTSQAIQDAMMDPDTALAYASSGVTLNDSPEVIAQKLAKYGYSKELADQSNDMASSGYTALVSGSSPAGATVVSITDSMGNVKKYYKKADPKSGSSVGETTSDIDVYAQAYFDEEIELTSIPQNIRASVIAKANKIAESVLNGTPIETTTTNTPSSSPKSAQQMGQSTADAITDGVIGVGDAVIGISNFFKGLAGF